jgi:hypothetical protein
LGLLIYVFIAYHDNNSATSGPSMYCDERETLLPATFIDLFGFRRISSSSARSKTDDLIADIPMYTVRRHGRNPYFFIRVRLQSCPTQILTPSTVFERQYQ